MFPEFDDVFNRIEYLPAPNRENMSKHLASKISVGRLVLNCIFGSRF
jgi:hypothetical protein